MAREFNSLSDKQASVAKIYKLVGPVLLAQDKSEAVMAVQARLEFIEKEMYVVLFLFFFVLEDDQKVLSCLPFFRSHGCRCAIWILVRFGRAPGEERRKRKKRNSISDLVCANSAFLGVDHIESGSKSRSKSSNSRAKTQRCRFVSPFSHFSSHPARVQ